MLVFVILGIADSYNILRWDILFINGTLALISISTRRYILGIILIGFSILFNPIWTPHLTKTNWIIADIFLIFFLLYWSWKYFQNYNKGLEFERFIQNKFPKEDWTIVEYTKDLHKKFNRFVEADSNPDFIFRKKINEKIIAIECKYRSDFWQSKKWGLGLSWDNNQ